MLVRLDRDRGFHHRRQLVELVMAVQLQVHAAMHPMLVSQQAAGVQERVQAAYQALSNFRTIDLQPSEMPFDLRRVCTSQLLGHPDMTVGAVTLCTRTAYLRHLCHSAPLLTTVLHLF